MFDDGSFMKENDFNRVVVDKLASYLNQLGINTIKVAPEINDTPLETRVKRANQSNADYYISIHVNAYGTSWNDANGFETLIFSGADSKTVEFAEHIHGKCITATGLRNRGIKERPDLYVLKSTKMPAILLECGFMTNKKEAELLVTDEYRDTVAKAILNGIVKFLNINTGGIEDMNIDEAKKIIQDKCGFDDNTIKYLEFYKFGESLITRLAEKLKNA